MCCWRSFLRIHQKSSGRERISHHETKRNETETETHPTKHDVKTAALSIQPYALHTFKYSSVNIRSMVTVVAYRT
jgi:hypothetical protein